MIKKISLILFALISISAAGYLFWLRTHNQIWNVSSIDSVTLYSVDGYASGKADFEPQENQEMFHGVPVLGKIQLDNDQQSEVINAMNKGIADGNSVAACFWPRHAVRIENDGVLTDYLICFHCYRIKRFADGSSDTISSTRSPKIVFNKVLSDAGIELAPESN